MRVASGPASADAVTVPEPSVGDLSVDEPAVAFSAVAAGEPAAETALDVVAIEPPVSDAPPFPLLDETAAGDRSEELDSAAANQPFAPDTQALLADLLSIIRPAAPQSDRAEAAPEESAADPTATASDGMQAAEGAAVPMAEVAAELPAMDAEDVFAAQAFDTAAPSEAELVSEVQSSAEPAATPVAEIGAEPVLEHDTLQSPPDAAAPSPISGFLPLEHVDIVEPGIMSSDFVIVPAEASSSEAERLEPIDVAEDVMRLDRGSASVAAETPWQLDSGEPAGSGGARDEILLVAAAPTGATAPSETLEDPAAELPDGDIIAVDTSEDFLLPVAEPFGWRAAVPAATTAADPPDSINVPFGSLGTTSVPASPAVTSTAIPDEPPVAAPDQSNDGITATAAEALAHLDFEIARPAILSTQASSLETPPVVEATSMVAADVSPPVAPMSGAVSDLVSPTPVAAMSAPTASPDPLSAITTLSVEERIALFS